MDLSGLSSVVRDTSKDSISGKISMLKFLSNLGTLFTGAQCPSKMEKERVFDGKKLTLSSCTAHKR